MFTQNDLKQFETKGIPSSVIEQQLQNFEKGFPFAQLVKPATVGDGLDQLSTETLNRLVAYYNKQLESISVVKFVPASGAASRMFKALFEFIDQAAEHDQKVLIQKEQGFNSPYNFIQNLKRFAFYPDLKETMKNVGLELEQLIETGNHVGVIDHLLNDKGLNYGSLPKGLLKFHAYEKDNRTSLEEHLVEAATYASKSGGEAFIHFTVSPEHLAKFKQKVEEAIPEYESMFEVHYQVTFSIQKPSTDTLAVDMENNPFRDTDGNITFRPGGHGALIENLNDIDADVVFVKNIDNIVPDRLKPETIRYKKAIGGLLLSLQEQIFKYLMQLTKENIEGALLDEISVFAHEKLNLHFVDSYKSYSAEDKRNYLIKKLNRPIRVCGMVKNEGEPGGGPFWVKNSWGEISLQIVESSQIDMNDDAQKKMVRSATHFNPVDLVCGIKNYQGEPFDLHHFVDPETGFISIKSKNGKSLKAQELPGLWNGAMADWITLFVEVPIITFNPVKTVNDLLREQHQQG